MTVQIERQLRPLSSKINQPPIWPLSRVQPSALSRSPISPQITSKNQEQTHLQTGSRAGGGDGRGGHALGAPPQRVRGTAGRRGGNEHRDADPFGHHVERKHGCFFVFPVRGGVHEGIS